MYLVKFIKNDQIEFRRFKNRSEEQVRGIIKGMSRKGFIHVSTTKQY